MPYERRDTHYRRAKAAGYRARSAYKLIELDDRFHIVRKGDRVVDLGAWPGGWLQVAAERAGPRGRVVGIDLAEVTSLGISTVTTIVGDVHDRTAILALKELLGGLAAVVLSDLAPKLTGVRDTDEARATDLASAVLDASRELLRSGGRLLMKLFMNSDFPSLMARLREDFERVTTTRPEATRRGSSEVYAIGVGYRRPPCG